jgi:Meiotically up-regulated gene 113
MANEDDLLVDAMSRARARRFRAQAHQFLRRPRFHIAAELLLDLLKAPRIKDHGRWRREGDFLVLGGTPGHNDEDYWIPLDRCQDALEILDWLLHLSNKSRISNEDLGALVRMMKSHAGAYSAIDRSRESHREAERVAKFAECVVYFLIELDVPAPKVKIGTTTRAGLSKRIEQIQNGNPNKLEPRLVIPGDRSVEQALHARFESSRCRGEWFLFEGAVEAFVSAGGRL